MFNIILLLSIIQVIMCAKIWDSNHKIRNISFKAIIFKEKKIPKLVNYIRDYYIIYRDKSLITIGDYINEYNNLSYEEKQLIDFILSLNNLN